MNKRTSLSIDLLTPAYQKLRVYRYPDTSILTFEMYDWDGVTSQERLLRAFDIEGSQITKLKDFLNNA